MLTLTPVLLLTCVMAGASSQQLILAHRDPLVVPQAVTNGIINARERFTNTDLSQVAKSAMFGSYMDEIFMRNNVSECASSIVRFGNDITQRKGYSLKMVDAWGKLSSGIERGNVVWMGRYYECLSASSQNFTGKWCLLSYGSQQKQGGEVPVIVPGIGMCVPNTCSQSQLTGMLHTISPNMSVSIYCPVQPTEYTSNEIAFLVIASFFGLLMLIGTCYEVHAKYSIDRQRYHQILNDGETVKPLQENHSMLGEILLSFSVIKSTRQILDTSQKDGNINVLHGIRFISMSWVVMGHAFSFGIQFYDNILDFANDIVTSTSYQAIVNATYSVDSFFFLSGLLATYLGMREMERSNGQVRVFTAYLYRYLRLTPAYALCIWAGVSIFSKMGDGPSWPQVAAGLRTPCSKYWWTNLIYINNMYPVGLGDECFGHGWYLANDMQFFLLSPFILLLLYKIPIIGGSVLAVGLLSSMATTMGLSLHYKEQPMVVTIGNLCKLALGSFLGFTSNVDNSYDANMTTPAPPPPAPSTADTFFSDLYTKPWCRIGVYLIGMATGYYLHRTRLRIQMNKIFSLLMWAIASVTALSVLYGLYPHVKGTDMSLIPNGTAAFYNAVCRPLWAFSLSWLVIACVSGYGGPINAFLSWKFFIPLSRLTYCAYLVHPIVIYWLFGSAEARLHYSIISLTITYLGLLLLSYGVAFVVSITIEMPMIRIMKLFFPHKKATHVPQPISNAATPTNA